MLYLHPPTSEDVKIQLHGPETYTCVVPWCECDSRNGNKFRRLSHD